MAKESRDFDLPEAVAAPKRQWSPQLVWLIPIVAVLVGGWLAVKAVLDRGPTITISFKTGEGLEAGKTKIKFKDVDVGEVKQIMLSEDRSGVVVTAELVKGAESSLVEDTHFWVVRPRIGAGGISGLGTLFSGSYIGVDIGKSTNRRKDFVGLEVPPVFTGDQPGREFVLRSQDVGSLDVSDPVFFRRVQVGRVVASELDKDGKGVTMKIFVNAPYDKYVTANTRFWHASGIDVTLDATGVKISTQSLATIVLGGIAFQTPPDTVLATPAQANTVFTLYADRAEAMKRPDLIARAWVFVFDESVRGLAVGAPVDFRGMSIGEVTEIGLQFDPVKKEFQTRVQASLHADRLRGRLKDPSLVTSASVEDRNRVLNTLVEHGFRAQLKTGNLLTGQLYVALDMFPTAKPAKIDWTKEPPEMPTMPGGLKELQETISRVAAKLEKVPVDQIGADLHETLQSIDKLVKRLDAEVAPEARLTLEEARRTLGTAERAFKPDAPLTQDTRETLRELSRTAQSLRLLADYLERHPEALIRGKKDQKQ